MKYALIATTIFLAMLFLSFNKKEEPIPIPSPQPTTPTPTPWPTYVPYGTFIDEDVLYELVNEWRVKNNKPRYITSETLCTMAEVRLTQLPTDPDHDGFYKLADKLVDNGTFEKVSENLITKYAGSAGVNEKTMLNDWLESKLHRAAIESSYVYSCLRCDNNDGNCVQLFAY